MRGACWIHREIGADAFAKPRPKCSRGVPFEITCRRRSRREIEIEIRGEMGSARSRELLVAVVQHELENGCDRVVLRFDTGHRRNVRLVNSVLHAVNASVDRAPWSVSVATHGNDVRASRA